MSQRQLTDVLIVCTRNRPTDLKRCLASVAASTHLPNRVVVVDSSDDDASRDVCHTSPLSVHHVRSAPGLTHQRNIGMRACSEDIVHFVDDDVEVAPDYLEKLCQAFMLDPSVVGAGGMVRGGEAGAPSWRARLGLMNSSRGGVVLKSGFNVGLFDYNRVTVASWLPGCSMSFRREAVTGLSFDERRRGYSTGEDVDFGLRAASRGVLLYVPGAQLVHHQSPVNRAKLPILVRSAVHSRWQLARDGLGDVTIGWVVYGTLSQVLHFAVKGVVRRDATYLRCAQQGTLGLVDVAFRGGAHVNV